MINQALYRWARRYDEGINNTFGGNCDPIGSGDWFDVAKSHSGRSLRQQIFDGC